MAASQRQPAPSTHGTNNEEGFYIVTGDPKVYESWHYENVEQRPVSSSKNIIKWIDLLHILRI